MRSIVLYAFVALLIATNRPAAQAQPPAESGVLRELARGVDARSMRASSSDPNWRDGNLDNRPIPPGETLELADLEGPGVINHIWNTVAPGELGYGRLLTLRIYWDGEESPSVECPLGDFFGVGHGLDESFASEPVAVSSDGRARNCYWPMPFRKSARITLHNGGERAVMAFFWYVDWAKVDELPADTLYFHAQYRQEHPVEMGRNYLIADIEGRGTYVGTLLNVRQHQGGWFGEGDDFFFIDGEEEPSLRGTGTEDYLCDAWGLREVHYPYYGVSYFEGLTAMSRLSAYRWHIPDPVYFSESLRLEIEHKGFGQLPDGSYSHFAEREDDFSSVAFWYQEEPHKPFPPLPKGYARLYHEPEDIIEIEERMDETEASLGDVASQGGPWSGSGQLLWTAMESGGELEVPFTLDEGGPLAMTLFFTRSFDYGIFDIAIDGELVAEDVDLYAPAMETWELDLEGLDLESGEHAFTFTNKGKDPESPAFFLGFDAALLRETAAP